MHTGRRDNNDPCDGVTHTFIYIHIYIYEYIYICIYIYIYMYIYICTQAGETTIIHAMVSHLQQELKSAEGSIKKDWCVSIYIYIYKHLYMLFIYVYIYTYINIHVHYRQCIF